MARLLLLTLALALAACNPPAMAADGATATPVPGGAALATLSPPAAAPTEPPAPSATAPAPPPTATRAAPPPTATALPTATPLPEPALRQLATGGCCVNPSWRADSGAVRFIDRPASAAPVGLYEIALDEDAPVSAGTLVTTTLPASFSAADGRFIVTTGPGQPTIEERATGRVTTLPEGASQISISPDGARVVWQIREDGGSGPSSQAESAFWTAAIDGSGARLLLRARGASVSGWLGDEALLLQARERGESDERVLLRLDLEEGRMEELARGARISGLALSPERRWLAFYISLDQIEPARNGLWLLDTATGERQQLPAAGAYRWRDGTRLLLMPMEMGARSMRLIEVDAATGDVRALTDPARLPFRVANNDWHVSPDGRHIVFVSADDGNLWLLTLGR